MHQHPPFGTALLNEVNAFRQVIEQVLILIVFDTQLQSFEGGRGRRGLPAAGGPKKRSEGA